MDVARSKMLIILYIGLKKKFDGIFGLKYPSIFFLFGLCFYIVMILNNKNEGILFSYVVHRRMCTVRCLPSLKFHYGMWSCSSLFFWPIRGRILLPMKMHCLYFFYICNLVFYLSFETFFYDFYISYHSLHSSLPLVILTDKRLLRASES